jgi:Fe-S-cluster containining protein
MKFRRIKHQGTASAMEEVRSVYKDLADRPLERSCELRTACCHFKLTGETPMVTDGEAMLAARAWRSAGRKELPPPRADGACPFLDERSSKCRIYESRPFACRTHFCEAAGGVYPRAHVLDLIRRLETVERTIDGRGPRKIEVAVREALAAIP